MPDDPAIARDDWPPSLWKELWREDPDKPSYWLTRFVLLRLLGGVYLVAFLTLILQGEALIGENGLLPTGQWLDFLEDRYHSVWNAFWEFPSIFWLGHSDAAILTVGWIGCILAAALLVGYGNGISLFLLWTLHLSVTQIGQRWYWFGWESQLAETGFLAIFLVPLLDPRPFAKRPPPVLVIWLYRWLIVRIMLGAGLIKIRGDDCWTELTCLATHYETQPVPNPLSSTLHFMPLWFHKLGTGFTHFVELVVPFFGFGPRRLRHLAGLFFVLLQITIIVSGNLSYLNWLTIVPALACFDDSIWRRLLPRALVTRAARAREDAATTRPQRVAVGVLTFVVATLSIQPVGNLLSGRQLMNASFDPFHLVNTYGAFGSIGKERPEIVLEGTLDPDPGPDTEWVAYEFKCKPTALDRRPCLITPYHYRLDWLMWFAAMGAPAEYPWSVHLVWKLLHADPLALSLLDGDPFAGRRPAYIRADVFIYEFAEPGSDAHWTRTFLGQWLPPMNAEDPRLHAFLRDHGWGPNVGRGP